MNPDPHEITFEISPNDLDTLEDIAAKWKCSRDEAATRLVREGLVKRCAAVINTLADQPQHPLLTGSHLGNMTDCQDALDRCRYTLAMLMDLFTDNDRHAALNTDDARRGVFIHLHGVMDTLEAISKALRMRS